MAKYKKKKEVFNAGDLQVESQLIEKYDFDNFIIGDSNQSARSAGFFVSCKQGETVFNPLFIYGESGLGKTHLAHAIGNETKKRFPNKNVMCITTDYFCQQYKDLLENSNKDNFVSWLELVDVLILENIQLLSGQTDVQEVILASFDTFCQKEKQIIITSDRELNELQGIKPQLLSRFKRGLMVALERPDYAIRLAVLEQLTSRSTIALSKEIIACIAQNIKSNIREVELCFNLLITEAQLHKKEITLDFTRKVLRNLDALVRKLSTMNLRDGYNSRIKIIGLGNAGCHIVNYLYNQKTIGVDFIVCDSDEEIIDSSTVPNKILLKDQVATDIGQPLDLMVNAMYDAIVGGDTEAVLILTETAETTKSVNASDIAQLAKERGIISVGIVIIPLFTEGRENLLDIDKLFKQFESLVVIDINRFKPINKVPSIESSLLQTMTAVVPIIKGITGLVQNPVFDIKDIKTILCNNNVIFAGFSVASGKKRAEKAIISALFSSVLREDQTANTKNILLLVTSGTNHITIDEIGGINDYLQSTVGYNANITMVVSEDKKLGKSISIAIITSGFESPI